MEHHQLGPKLPICLAVLPALWVPWHTQALHQSKAGVGWLGQVLALCTLSHVVCKAGTITPPSCGAVSRFSVGISETQLLAGGIPEIVVLAVFTVVTCSQSGPTPSCHPPGLGKLAAVCTPHRAFQGPGEPWAQNTCLKWFQCCLAAGLHLCCGSPCCTPPRCGGCPVRGCRHLGPESLLLTHALYTHSCTYTHHTHMLATFTQSHIPFHTLTCLHSHMPTLVCMHIHTLM